MQDIQTLMRDGQLEEARRLLTARIHEGAASTTGHDEEARLAEELGLSAAAICAWQLVLRDHPGHVAAWESLERLHGERGDTARAAACRDQLTLLGVRPPAVPTFDEEPAPPPGASDADLVRFVHLFAGREGVHARMWHDPVRGVGYSPVPRQLTPELARAHLDGGLTLGVYPVTRDGLVGWIVLDLDLTKAAIERARGDLHATQTLHHLTHTEGLTLLRRARALGLRPLFEDSGFKGRHLWCFLPQPIPAAQAHAWGRDALAHLAPEHPDLHLELFPKQAQVEPDGLGNLVKLPLGIHLRSGRRSNLLDDQGAPVADPFAVLRAVARLPLPALGPAPARAAKAPPAPATTPPPVPAETPAWTEAELDTSPEVGGVLRGCALLRAVVDGALKDRALDSAATLALTHTLGHLGDGVRACNHLFDRVPGFPAASRLVSPLRGSPTSCATLRKRLPELVSRVPCDCAFPEQAGRYPHPLRHLEELPAPTPRARTLDELLDAYTRQVERVKEVQGELDALRRAVVTALERAPGGVWTHRGGQWRVLSEGGLPHLRWEAPE